VYDLSHNIFKGNNPQSNFAKHYGPAASTKMPVNLPSFDQITFPKKISNIHFEIF